MQLTFSLSLPAALYAELIESCETCSCTPKEFAAQSLEAILASRRLPKIRAGRCGPRFTAGVSRESDEDGYRVIVPMGISGTE
jgi:hypothetical protein